MVLERNGSPEEVAAARIEAAPTREYKLQRHWREYTRSRGRGRGTGKDEEVVLI